MSDPRATFPAFVDAVRARLELGARAYAESPAAERAAHELAGEMAQELEDLAGWAACLWPRVVALQGALVRLGPAPTAPAPAAAEPNGTHARPPVLAFSFSSEELVLIGALSERLGVPPAEVVRLGVHALAGEQATRRRARATTRSLTP